MSAENGKNYGKIIVLNGPSSAGKTTLSRNLQKIWDRPLYYLSYDSVDWYMAPFGVTGRDYGGMDTVRDFLAVMYESAAAICRSGRDVVIDNCLFDCEDICALSAEIMKDCPVTMVRVKLPLEELERREIARGDRTPGKARWQEEHITPKEDSAYDVIVDTSDDSMECAEKIRNFFE
ncbi:MAG: AAA family ATPase [Clostridia bacterium]|nr:AAA family ATPase [Clostridia bacterium]